jgi:hypothetical protein
VARWHNYHTSQSFMRAMETAFPALSFQKVTASVEGGFGPSHQLYCSRGEWTTSDIIFVHFAEFAANGAGSGASALLGALMALPQRPLVLVVKHCSFPMLEMLIDERGAPANVSAVRGSLWCRRDKHCAKLRALPEAQRSTLGSTLDDLTRATTTTTSPPLALSPTAAVPTATSQRLAAGTAAHAARPSANAALAAQMLTYALNQARFEAMDNELMRAFNVTTVDTHTRLTQCTHSLHTRTCILHAIRALFSLRRVHCACRTGRLV